MKTKTLLAILVMITFLMIGTLFYMMVSNNLERIEDTLERCKSKGWDGVEFRGRYSNEVICSNFSQAEKDAKYGGSEQ